MPKWLKVLLLILFLIICIYVIGVFLVFNIFTRDNAKSVQLNAEISRPRGSNLNSAKQIDHKNEIKKSSVAYNAASSNPHEDSLEQLFWLSKNGPEVNLRTLCSNLCEYSSFNSELDSISLFFEQHSDTWNNDPKYMLALLNHRQILGLIDIDFLEILMKPKEALTYADKLEVAVKLPIAIAKFTKNKNELVKNQEIINRILNFHKSCSTNPIENIQLNCLKEIESFNREIYQ